MLAYFEDIVNTLDRPRNYLLGASFALVTLLIILANLQVVPPDNLGDFIFFAVLFLALALYRPGWSFLIFICVLPLENVNLAPESLGFMLRPYQFVGALTLGAVLLRSMLKRMSFDLPRWRMADGLVGLFLAVGFLSAATGLDKGTSFKQSVILLSFGALYFLARVFIQNGEDLKKVAPFFVGSSLIAMTYGLWQNIRFARGLESFEVMPGRPNATFAEADWLGMYLVFALAALYLMVRYFAGKGGKPEGEGKVQVSEWKIGKEDWIMAGCWSLVTLTYVLLILTVSRSAWLGALAVTVAFLGLIFTGLKMDPKEWQWKEMLRLKGWILLALAIAILTVNLFNLTTFQLWNRAASTGSGLQAITVSCQGESALPEKIGSVADLADYGCRHIGLEEVAAEKTAGRIIKEVDRPDPNVDIRSRIYRQSWDTIMAHPIFGIGWGNSARILGTDERGTPLNSSNIFLEAWLGGGIGGVLALLSIGCLLFFRGYKLFQHSGSEATGLFVLLGCTALLIPNLFNAGIFLGFLWVFLGAAASLTSNDYKKYEA